jgi:hypothetical protein
VKTSKPSEKEFLTQVKSARSLPDTFETVPTTRTRPRKLVSPLRVLPMGVTLQIVQAHSQSIAVEFIKIV